jgi:hypothetical protein
MLTFCNTPQIFSAFDNPAISSCHILGRTNDGERHCVQQNTSVFCSNLIISVNGGLVYPNALSGDDFPDLFANVN